MQGVSGQGKGRANAATARVRRIATFNEEHKNNEHDIDRERALLVLPTGGSKPEPTQAERDRHIAANRQPGPETKKEYNLSDSDFAYLPSIQGFPAIIGYDAPHVAVRRRDKVAEWFANMHRILANVRVIAAGRPTWSFRGRPTAVLDVTSPPETTAI